MTTTIEIEIDMTTKEKSIADELMEMLDGSGIDVSAEDAAAMAAGPEEATLPPAIVLPKLEATEWEAHGEGEVRLVPFSECDWGWEPKHAPDHLVPHFKGFDSGDIMSGYIPPKKDFEWVSFAFAKGIKPLSVGPTGCGKTLMYEYYGAVTGRPVLRVDNTQELDKAQVFGTVHITDGDTDFVPGDIPLSCAAPTVVILDELSRATGGANMIYKRMLDRNEVYMPEMKESGAKAITPDKYWVLCATDNTKGDGEDLDKYPMSNVQDAAFRNAWGILLEADYLDKSEETDMVRSLTSKKMPMKEAKKLATFSYLIHAGFKKGEINTAFSPRQLVNICDMYMGGVELRVAVQMCYINFVSSSELADVNESLRAAFGSA
jgi:MoxR-like ATPase